MEEKKNKIANEKDKVTEKDKEQKKRSQLTDKTTSKNSDKEWKKSNTINNNQATYD